MWYFFSSFLISILFLGLVPLPSFNLALIAISAMGMLAFLNINSKNILISGFCCGFFAVILAISSYHTKTNLTGIVGHDVETIGNISSSVIAQKSFCSFIITTQKIAGKSRKLKIRSTYYNKNRCDFIPGQKWSFILRIKPVGGVKSPGASDAELNAIVRGIHATSYVKSRTTPLFIEDNWYLYPFLRLQHILWHKYLVNAKDCKYSGVVSALMFGIQEHIQDSTFKLFADMGISHLLAISGLHVGMMAMTSSTIFSVLWRFNPRLLFILPAQIFGSFFGVLTAFCYTAIAGFGIPAFRSLTMLVIYFVSRIIRVRIFLWQLLVISAFIQAILWPPSLWGRSFILSYFAVLILIINGHGKIYRKNIFSKYIRPQLGLTVGLLPWVIEFWQQFPVYGFFINFFAIPLFSIFIVPLSFIIILTVNFPTISRFFAKVVDLILGNFFIFLNWIQINTIAVIEVSNIDLFSIFCLVVAIFLILMPPGFPARKLAILFFAPLFFCEGELVQAGEVKLSVLDVGQGLSVLIQTTNHNILFDTGPAIPGGYSAGKNVVNPYLRFSGIKQLDEVVISHPDLDHIGGLSAIKEANKIVALFSSVGMKDSKICQANTSWSHDGVQFKFLWPNGDFSSKKNNNSCVLQVKTKNSSILIPGDIEAKAESRLLREQNLSSSILIAPHHGSKGSSSKDFIAAVSPKIVIFATGKNNRFSFPHIDTTKRYACSIKTICLNTATSGTITILTNKDKWRISEYRKMFRYIW